MMSNTDGPLLQRRVLDAQVADLPQRSPAAWGVRPWLGPVLSVLALIVVLRLIASQVRFHGSAVAIADAVAGIAGDAVLLAALVLCGHAAARSGGGWKQTFGLVEPAAVDVKPWLTGFAVLYLARVVLGAVANGLTHGRATREAANLRLHDITPVGLILLILAVAVVAPVVEELIFRGLLLRTFMRRMGFWPAAWISSIIFGVIHVYEVKTVVGAITLASGAVLLGLTNCLLVRATGRLAPGMLVHASFNLIAVLLLTHTNH